MVTDMELKLEGMNVLLERLGLVEAERFISLLQREKFDSQVGPYLETLLRSYRVKTAGYGPAYNPFPAERTIPRSFAPGFVHFT